MGVEGLQVEFKKLELRPGDIVAMKIIDKRIVAEDVKRLVHAIEGDLPEGVKIIVYPAEGIEFEVVSGASDEKN